MKDNALQKIYRHPDREELISQLTLNIDPKEINLWLREKYQAVGDKKLIFSAKVLQEFKDEYLDLYRQMRQDMVIVSQEQTNTVQDMTDAVQMNPTYKQLLTEYAETELDIKTMVRNMLLAIQHRAMQVFDEIQGGTKKMDYVLIQWFNVLLLSLEKYDTIINGSPDTIIQQNTVNIQILDQHISVFHKVIRDVIARLDYDTSLLFTQILNEELSKLKPADIPDTLPIDVRLSEAKKLEDGISKQLDVPF